MSASSPASHILTFAQTLAGGGVERAMLRLAGHWVAAGRRVTIVIGSTEGPLAAELPDGAELIVLGDPRHAALRTALPGIVAETRPDAIFCPGNHYSIDAAWLRLRLGRRCPAIVAKVSNALVRADMGWIAPGYRAWLRLHPRFLDAVVAMTPGMAKEAVAAMGIAADRVHVIPNPPALPRPGAPLPPLPPRYIAGVGRLAPQKRWDRALAALAALDDRDIPLVIAGDGPLRDSLLDQAQRLVVAHRLHLLGHVADPLPLIERAALVVLSSDYEGVPGVLREALALGTPVVTTDSSVAVREIVDDPARGTVVPVDDTSALVAAIDTWLAGRPRPAPQAGGGDPAGDYLSLFDSLASSSSSS